MSTLVKAHQQKFQIVDTAGPATEFFRDSSQQGIA